MTRAVTGYVPIPGHPRSEAEYHRLGVQLVDNKKTIFAEGTLQDCWLYDYLDDTYGMDTTKFTHSIADNPKKNSLDYHIVQAQKTEWLVAAAKFDPFSKVFAWIDYGIFSIPGVTIEI